MSIPGTQPEPATVPAAPARDSREAFMPGDPLGTRLGGDSIAGTASQGDHIAALARASSKPEVADHNRDETSDAGIAVGVLLIIAGLALLALYLYRRRGRFNFAGQDGNR